MHVCREFDTSHPVDAAERKTLLQCLLWIQITYLAPSISLIRSNLRSSSRSPSRSLWPISLLYFCTPSHLCHLLFTRVVSRQLSSSVFCSLVYSSFNVHITNGDNMSDTNAFSTAIVSNYILVLILKFDIAFRVFNSTHYVWISSWTKVAATSRKI